jgi:hypothetical protein
MSAVASPDGLLTIFRARAEARAKLWQCRELSLHEAVDELQAAAKRDGLVAQLGQDRLQVIMSDALKRALREGAR